MIVSVPPIISYETGGFRVTLWGIKRYAKHGAKVNYNTGKFYRTVNTTISLRIIGLLCFLPRLVL
jgi:hypothetical protein